MFTLSQLCRYRAQLNNIFLSHYNTFLNFFLEPIFAAFSRFVFIFSVPMIKFFSRFSKQRCKIPHNTVTHIRFASLFFTLGDLLPTVVSRSLDIMPSSYSEGSCFLPLLPSFLRSHSTSLLWFNSSLWGRRCTSSRSFLRKCVWELHIWEDCICWKIGFPRWH